MELHNRPELERVFAARLGYLWSGQRRELTRLLGDPPDLSKIPDEFWDKAKRDNDAAIALLLYMVLTHSAEQHLSLVHRNDRVWSRLAGDERTAQVFGQLEPHLADAAKQQAADISARIDQRNRDALAKAFEGESAVTKTDVRQLGSRLFGESPAARTAVTGTTWGRAQGGEITIGRTVGFSPNDLWLVVYGSGIEDQRVCPTCSHLNDMPRTMWGRFFPAGPPAHESCRCIVTYAMELAAAASA